MAEQRQPTTSLDAQGDHIAQATGGGTATVTHTEHKYESVGALAEESNRRALLSLVRHAWIAGVLEPSRRDLTDLQLGLTEDPQGIAQPTRIVRLRDDPPRVIPPSTPIGQLFDAASGRLLILGAPGSGKTTLLLELAESLLDRAEQDPIVPLPVVFNLASWAGTHIAIDEWLVAELNQHHHVAGDLATHWVQHGRILPLLDGLDEVQAPSERVACVAAINAYRPTHGVAQLAVCSRTDEYRTAALAGKLHLDTAVMIQPLRPEQIDTALASAGPHLAGLRTAVEQDPVLRTLAESPLLLGVMARTYRDQEAASLIGPGTREERTRRLWAEYVDTMLPEVEPAPVQERPRPVDERGRTVDLRYRRERALRWLTWLAQGMVAQGQSVFLLEELHPDWMRLNTMPPAEAKNYRWTLRWVRGLVRGLGAGLILGLIVGLLETSVRTGPILGLAGGLVFGLLGMIRLTRSVYAGLAGLLVPLAGGLLVWRNVSSPYGELFIGTLFGIMAFFLAYGLIGGLADESQPIQLSESLSWSVGETLRAGTREWKTRRTLLGASCGLAIRLAADLTAGPLFEPSVQWLRDLINYGLIFGVTTAINGMIYSGILPREVERKTSPNQGIWYSGRSATLVFVVLGVVGVLVGSLVLAAMALMSSYGDLVSGEIFTDRSWLRTNGGVALIVGMVVGTIAGSHRGGFTFVNHFVWRFAFWRCGVLPWHYARFLDFAAERLLLRKVGGGYIFLHRLLLEHFSALDQGDSRTASRSARVDSRQHGLPPSLLGATIRRSGEEEGATVMDPITAAIVAALAAGATKAADAVGGQVVKDAYDGLKALLKRKLGDQSEVAKAIEGVEARPDSAGRKETLKEEVAASQVDQDQEVVTAAQELLARLKERPGGGQIIQQATGSYIAQAEGGSTANVQVNSPKD